LRNHSTRDLHEFTWPLAVCRPQDPFLIHFTASEDVIGVICFGKKGHESRLCLVLGEFVPAYI
jgi:hypothetical protein